MASAVEKTSEIDPVDKWIGKKLRELRNIERMTQQRLAQKIGVSFQQIQKYESCENRIYASKLYHISKVLKKDISYFFEDIETNLQGMSDQAQDGFSYDSEDNEANISDTEIRTVLQAYASIDDKKKRKTAIDMLKGLAS